MFRVQTNDIVHALVTSGWDRIRAGIFAERYPELPEVFRTLVQEWQQTGVASAFSLDGVALHDVMEARREHFYVCIRNMARVHSMPNISNAERHDLMELLTKPIRIE